MASLAHDFDTGIDFEHDDLFVLPKLSRNFVSAEPNDGEDLNFHGTHVAGIIGARNNDLDVIASCRATRWSPFASSTLRAAASRPRSSPAWTTSHRSPVVATW